MFASYMRIMRRRAPHAREHMLYCRGRGYSARVIDAAILRRYAAMLIRRFIAALVFAITLPPALLRHA